MGDTYYHLIPTAPAWVPPVDRQKTAHEAVAKVYPRAEAITLHVYDEIRVIDAGENFETVSCPFCGTRWAIPWWQAEMDRLYENRFTNLDISTPCCGKPSSMNDAIFYFPMGFARFDIEIMNPRDGRDVPPALIAECERILGCRLRIVYQKC